MDAVVSFLFKYPSRVWARGDVVWSPVVPVWLVIVLAVVALAVAAVAYARVRGVPRLERGTMFALRTLALLIVVACLLRPTLVVASMLRCASTGSPPMCVRRVMRRICPQRARAPTLPRRSTARATNSRAHRWPA